MSTIVTDSYSDLDLHDPAEYYGGFKEGLVSRFGDTVRRLSHPVTGEHRGSTFDFEILDPDLRFRQQFASVSNRYWSEALAVRMTTRENRAVLGTPYTAFVGPIISAQPTKPLGWRVTLGDLVSSLLLSDQSQSPSRVIGDGFLDQITVSSTLDRTLAEPIIYGEHRRTPEGVASQHGFMVRPIYLGIESLNGTDYHVWMLAGHAVTDIPDVNTVDADGVLNSVIPDEGTDWLIPHHAGFALEFGAPYRDLRSSTFGVDRRYTLIYGLVGATEPDAVADGTLSLAVSVDGVEDVGDSSGACITDRIQQYKHWATNFMRPDSYQSGPWLTTFEWNILGDGLIPVIDEDSFDAASLIAEERLPAAGGSPGVPAGYIGAALIGDVKSQRDYVADWNRSCGLRSYWTNHGQFKVVMLHPTAAIKAAAPLFTAAYEMLEGSFDTDIGWSDHANRIPFRADYNTVLGRWETIDAAEAGDSITKYNRVILGEVREYPFAPGITAAYHLARLEALQFQHPPRTLSHDTSLGELASLDVGDYVRYQSHAAIANTPGEIRLGWIVGHGVRVGARRMTVEILDVEDLIDYDAGVVYEAGNNETCETAIDLDMIADTPEIFNIDTELHATDSSVEGLMPGPGIAYHAAWWKGTPPADGTLFITTVHSLYDTQMGVFTGTCGGSPTGLVLEEYNDNDGAMQTSILSVPVTMGTEYFILIAGYGPADGGSLTFASQFIEP